MRRLFQALPRKMGNLEKRFRKINSEKTFDKRLVLERLVWYDSLE
jgi:hypothetical protein